MKFKRLCVCFVWKVVHYHECEVVGVAGRNGLKMKESGRERRREGLGIFYF